MCCLCQANDGQNIVHSLVRIALHLMDSVSFQRCAMSMLVLEKIKTGNPDAILKEKLRLINYPKAISCVLSECLENLRIQSTRLH